MFKNVLEKKRLIILIAAIAITAAGVASLLTYYITTNRIERGEIYLKGQTYDELMNYFDLYQIKELIEDHYLLEVEEDILINGSFRGMVNSLGDSVSQFYAKEDYNHYDEAQNDSRIAEGMLIAKELGEYPVVKTVFADGAAIELGISAGDRIITIDGWDTKSMYPDVVLGRIRGASGTSVSIEVRSADGTQETYELVRNQKDVQLVYSDMINDKIGYINIVELSGKGSEQFETALTILGNENATGAIIDLRGCKSGNITVAVNILEQLMDAGTVTYTMGKDGEQGRWETKGAASYTKPIAVLVDGETAGVAEIFAAAVRDRGRGQIYGETTRGEAVATTVYEIPGTGNWVKLVTGVYHSPNGTAFDGSGVVPDEALVEDADYPYAILQQAAELLGS